MGRRGDTAPSQANNAQASGTGDVSSADIVSDGSSPQMPEVSSFCCNYSLPGLGLSAKCHIPFYSRPFIWGSFAYLSVVNLTKQHLLLASLELLSHVTIPDINL